MESRVGYIAYIDEAGDDGLQRIRPTSSGASEFLVLSCLLIRADREVEVLPWLKALVAGLNQHQITHLHFRQLRPEKKMLAASTIANLPVRLFTVISHKRNMRNYTNLSAAKAKINVTAWFYVWLIRILVERVSDYCLRKTHRDHGGLTSIRFEFASRGGVKVGDVARYFEYLREQEKFGLLYHEHWVPKWDVMDFNEIRSFPAKARAGLQLVDCVASAFFQALELTNEGSVNSDFAKLLAPRMCLSSRNRIYGYGVKVWPEHAALLVKANQAEILEYYRTR